MAGFDISKCNTDAKCKDIVQRLDDSCVMDALLKNDFTIEPVCKDKYIGQGVPYDAGDPIYLNQADNKKPITQADYDLLQGIRGASAPVTPPADETPVDEPVGPPAPAQSWGAEEAGAVAPVVLSDEAYLPENEFQRKHLTLRLGMNLTMHSTTEGGLSYQDDVSYEGDTQNTQKMQEFAVPGIRIGADWNFSHLAKANDVAKRTANGEVVTHGELLTPWQVGLSFDWEGYFLKPINRHVDDEDQVNDVNENKGTAHSLTLGFKADYRVNRYLGFGAGVSYGNFFTYDGISLNIEGDKQYGVFGAGDSPCVHAIGAELYGRIHANESFDVLAGLSFRRFFTYGEELYQGSNGDIGINMFLFNISVALGLGDVYDFTKSEDVSIPQSVEDYFVVSKVDECAYAIPPAMVAEWKAEFDKSKKAVEDNPKDHEAMYKLGLSAAGLGKKKDAEQAEALLRKLLKEAEDDAVPTEETKKTIDRIRVLVSDLAEFVGQDYVQRNYVCREGGEFAAGNSGSPSSSTSSGSTPTGEVSGWGDL